MLRIPLTGASHKNVYNHRVNKLPHLLELVVKESTICLDHVVYTEHEFSKNLKKIIVVYKSKFVSKLK